MGRGQGGGRNRRRRRLRRHWLVRQQNNQQHGNHVTEPKHFRVTKAYVVDREQNERDGEVGGDHFGRQPRDRVVQRLARLRIEEIPRIRAIDTASVTTPAAAADFAIDPQDPGPNDSTPLAGCYGDERQRGEEDVITGIESVPQRRDGVSQVKIPRRRMTRINEMPKPNRRQLIPLLDQQLRTVSRFDLPDVHVLYEIPFGLFRLLVVASVTETSGVVGDIAKDPTKVIPETDQGGGNEEERESLELPVSPDEVLINEPLHRDQRHDFHHQIAADQTLDQFLHNGAHGMRTL